MIKFSSGSLSLNNIDEFWWLFDFFQYPINLCHKETYKALQTSTKKDKKRKELCYFSAGRFYDLTQSELHVDLPGGFVDGVL